MNPNTVVVKSLDTFSASLVVNGRELELVGIVIPESAIQGCGVALPVPAVKELIVNLQTRVDAAVAYRGAHPPKD